MNLSESLKREFFSGWRPFEVVWLVLFITAQMIAYYYDPQSLLSMISGIARSEERRVGKECRSRWSPYH